MLSNLASRLRSGFRSGLLTAAGALLCLAALVPPARALSNVDSLTVTFTPKDTIPPLPVKDLTGVSGAEGQMMLQWTAPDSNSNVFTTSSPVAGYQIRVATYSVVSIGGSTTTWWNSATDVRALPAPALSVSPPAPAFPGTMQYLLLNQLWPGVTYYALIVSSDSGGNMSDADLHARTPGAQANTLVFDAPPPTPTNLSAAAASPSSFDVSWSSISAYDLDYYKIYFDSTPPYDFSHSSSTIVLPPATTDHIVGLSTGTYIIRVTAVDRGQPRYPGVARESVTTSSVTIQLLPVIHQPQAPYGVTLTSTSATTTLHWMPVVRFADQIPFAASTAPTAGEMSGYSVFRATTPVLAVWKDVADVSTGTLAWTDLASGPQYYYHVRAQNDSSWSDRSVVLAPATGAAYFVAPDDMSFYQVKATGVSSIEGAITNADDAYLVSVSSRGQDLGALNGRVMKSLQFDAYQGGHLLAPGFALSEPGLLSLHYEVSTSSQVRASSLSAEGVTATPSNMSVYWFNGANWVQLYGTLDKASQRMTIQTKFLGRYQLRSVERTGGFAFNVAGVSNRYLTPNGDGKNDNVVFTFDNPKGSAVTAKILDVGGRVVAASLPPGPVVGESLLWDGTSGGRSVPGGVYIYQIQAEGQTYSGTLVIIK